MPDLHRIGKRFQRGKASLEDVVRVYQAILSVGCFCMPIHNMNKDAYCILPRNSFVALAKNLQT